MKRETFIISVNGNPVMKRHAWNASLRAIEQHVREIASSEKTVYKLINFESLRDGFHFVRGHRTWSSHEHKVIRFDIEKLA